MGMFQAVMASMPALTAYAIRPAHRSASIEESDPSTPTTIRRLQTSSPMIGVPATTAESLSVPM